MQNYGFCTWFDCMSSSKFVWDNNYCRCFHATLSFWSGVGLCTQRLVKLPPPQRIESRCLTCICSQEVLSCMSWCWFCKVFSNSIRECFAPPSRFTGVASGTAPAVPIWTTNHVSWNFSIRECFEPPSRDWTYFTCKSASVQAKSDLHSSKLDQGKVRNYKKSWELLSAGRFTHSLGVLSDNMQAKSDMLSSKFGLWKIEWIQTCVGGHADF